MYQQMNSSHPSTQEAQPESRRGRFRMVLLVGSVLLVEAAALVGILAFSGGLTTVQAGDAHQFVEGESGDRIIEVLVLDDRLENNRAGATHVFDTEIWVHAQSRHHHAVSMELDRLRNEIRAEINAVWKSSEPRHLREPELQTVTRRMHDLLADRFGRDELTGEPVIRKCVIVAGTGFRADN